MYHRFFGCKETPIGHTRVISRIGSKPKASPQTFVSQAMLAAHIVLRQRPSVWILHFLERHGFSCDILVDLQKIIGGIN